MLRKFASHLRDQWIGTIALFFVLTGGTAWAVNGSLPGKNTVGSADIINAEVKEQDLGAQAVTADKLATDAVTNPKLADDAVGSAEVTPNSLGGGDINESSLAQVPSATLGGYGRHADLHAFSSCEPTSSTFIDCGFTALNLPSATRVLVIATTNKYSSENPGDCRIATSSGFVGGETGTGSTGVVTVHAITGLVGPGVVDFGLECAGNPGSPDPKFTQVSVSAVALSPN